MRVQTLTTEFAASGGAWQPDARLKLALAALSTVLVVLGFVALLRQPPMSERNTVTLTLLQASLPPTPRKPRAPASIRPTQLAPERPSGAPPQRPIRGSVDWQEAMQAAVETDTTVEDGDGFPSRKPRADTGDLRRALLAPPPPPVMQQGDAYRSAYGTTVLNSQGMCGESQTVHVGPAPQAQAVVTAPVACPGAYQPSMGEELLNWAKKMQQRLPRPPH